MTDLRLNFGLDSTELYSRDGLARLDRIFVDWLNAGNVELANRLLAARAAPAAIEALAESSLLIDLGAVLERFLGELFAIAAPLAALSATTRSIDPIWGVKRNFVQRRALKAHKTDAAAGFDGPALATALEAAMGEVLTESECRSQR